MTGILFFILFLLTSISAILLYFKGRFKLVFISILLIAVVPRIWLINNPILGNNDEKYHALVAKNMIDHPLIPTLYSNPVLPYDIADWTGNYLWLSKPPVALWLMAGSIHLLGNHVVSVRLASLMLSVLTILLLFYLGKLLFGTKEGLIAMFLMAIQGTFIEMGAGEISSDHVDVCFTFLFISTLYFALKSTYPQKHFLAYPILIGISFGLLFLTKWHASFIILPIILSLYAFKRRDISNPFAQLTISALTSTIVVLPWLLYIYDSFPVEFVHMKNALISPISEVIHGHSGPWYYYIDKIGKLYGEFIYLALILLTLKLIKKPTWQMALIMAWFIIPLIGFSFSETKRFTYILIIAPSLFLLSGYLINQKLTLSFIPKWFQSILYIGLIALPIRFSIERVDYFTSHSAQFAAERQWQKNLIGFARTVKNENIIIFNTPKYIETMFYSNCVAYPYLPKKQTVLQLKAQGYDCYNNKDGSYIQL